MDDINEQTLTAAGSSTSEVKSTSYYCLFLSGPRTNVNLKLHSVMSPPTLAELLGRNRTYAPSHTPSPTVAEMVASGGPGTRVLVVTCLDARCEPYEFMKISKWEALAFRTVGGRVGPQMDGILALDTMFNFQEIAIIHHTNCGATLFTKESVSAVLKKRVPDDAEQIDAMTFPDFTDIAGSVRDDLALFRANSYVSKQLREHAHGFVFDIVTGTLTNVEK